ncbi:MAG: hypothetical protein ACR2N7_03260, partial [Acidimicrobiia bacterium]
MGEWVKDHGATVAATFIAATLTAIFGFIALQSILSWIDPDRVDPGFSRGALILGGSTTSSNSAAVQNATAIIAILFSAVVLVSAIIVVGLVRRKSAARESAFVVYGLLGFISIATSLSGLNSDPPAPSAWFGVATGLANLSIVVLLLLPSVARDFD